MMMKPVLIPSKPKPTSEHGIRQTTGTKKKKKNEEIQHNIDTCQYSTLLWIPFPSAGTRTPTGVRVER
jgi:hypothetical protein